MTNDTPRSFTWESRAALAIRLFLGLVFLYASIDKVLHPTAFAKAVNNYQILPPVLVIPLAVVLPWLELFIGLSLVLGVFSYGAIFLTNSLLAVFIAALFYNKARGLDVDCGCFSTASNANDGGSSLLSLLRDLGFFALALYLAFLAFRRRVEIQSKWLYRLLNR